MQPDTKAKIPRQKKSSSPADPFIHTLMHALHHEQRDSCASDPANPRIPIPIILTDSDQNPHLDSDSDHLHHIIR
jgi:hypothetical protein